MKKNIWMLMISTVMVMGCSPAPFIIVEQAASSPSFTIIPYDGDTDFSRQIEREILALNLRVVERPELKFIATDAQKTESNSSGASSSYGRNAAAVMSGESVTASLYKIDVVAMYPAAKSDYIVVTYSKSKEIRILRKEDLALIASGAHDGIIDLRSFVMSILVHAKFIENKGLTKECQVVTRSAN